MTGTSGFLNLPDNQKRCQVKVREDCLREKLFHEVQKQCDPEAEGKEEPHPNADVTRPDVGQCIQGLPIQALAKARAASQGGEPRSFY